MAATVVDLTRSSPSTDASTGLTLQEDNLLHWVIETAQPDRLRGVLGKICRRLPEATQLARELLLVSEQEVQMGKHRIRTSDDESEDEGESQQGNTTEESKDENQGLLEIEDNSSAKRKRLRPKYALCSQCKEEYDTSSNQKGDCIWHPGKPVAK